MPLPVCADGVSFMNPSEARSCMEKLEKETDKPHKVRDRGVGSPKMKVIVHTVEEIDNCTDGAEFDSRFATNEIFARECSEALTKMTKISHEARLVKTRWLCADVYQVVKKR